MEIIYDKIRKNHKWETGFINFHKQSIVLSDENNNEIETFQITSSEPKITFAGTSRDIMLRKFVIRDDEDYTDLLIKHIEEIRSKPRNSIQISIQKELPALIKIGDYKQVNNYKEQNSQTAIKIGCNYNLNQKNDNNNQNTKLSLEENKDDVEQKEKKKKSKNKQDQDNTDLKKSKEDTEVIEVLEKIIFGDKLEINDLSIEFCKKCINYAKTLTTTEINNLVNPRIVIRKLKTDKNTTLVSIDDFNQPNGKFLKKINEQFAIENDIYSLDSSNIISYISDLNSCALKYIYLTALGILSSFCEFLIYSQTENIIKEKCISSYTQSLAGQSLQNQNNFYSFAEFYTKDCFILQRTISQVNAVTHSYNFPILLQQNNIKQISIKQKEKNLQNKIEWKLLFSPYILSGKNIFPQQKEKEKEQQTITTKILSYFSKGDIYIILINENNEQNSNITSKNKQKFSLFMFASTDYQTVRSNYNNYIKDSNYLYEITLEPITTTSGLMEKLLLNLDEKDVKLIEGIKSARNKFISDIQSSSGITQFNSSSTVIADEKVDFSPVSILHFQGISSLVFTLSTSIGVILANNEINNKILREYKEDNNVTKNNYDFLQDVLSPFLAENSINLYSENNTLVKDRKKNLDYMKKSQSITGNTFFMPMLPNLAHFLRLEIEEKNRASKKKEDQILLTKDVEKFKNLINKILIKEENEFSKNWEYIFKENENTKEIIKKEETENLYDQLEIEKKNINEKFNKLNEYKITKSHLNNLFNIQGQSNFQNENKQNISLVTASMLNFLILSQKVDEKEKNFIEDAQHFAINNNMNTYQTLVFMVIGKWLQKKQETYKNILSRNNIEDIISDYLQDSINTMLIRGIFGSGKSQLLSFLLIYFYKNNIRVLISSNTNTAIDNILKRISKLIDQTPESLERIKKGKQPLSHMIVGRIGNDKMEKIPKELKVYLIDKKTPLFEKMFVFTTCASAHRITEYCRTTYINYGISVDFPVVLIDEAGQVTEMNILSLLFHLGQPKIIHSKNATNLNKVFDDITPQLASNYILNSLDPYNFNNNTNDKINNEEDRTDTTSRILYGNSKFGCELLILAGDSAQLQPIAPYQIYQTSLLDKMLKNDKILTTFFSNYDKGNINTSTKSIYNTEKIINGLRAINNQLSTISLWIQYRCHPTISEISNLLFYNGKVETAEYCKKLTSYIPGLNPGVSSIHLEGLSDRAINGSRFNPSEAEVVVKFIIKIIEQSYMRFLKQINTKIQYTIDNLISLAKKVGIIFLKDIGVITPYLAQSEIIKTKIKQNIMKSKILSHFIQFASGNINQNVLKINNNNYSSKKITLGSSNTIKTKENQTQEKNSIENDDLTLSCLADQIFDKNINNTLGNESLNKSLHDFSMLESQLIYDDLSDSQSSLTVTSNDFNNNINPEETKEYELIEQTVLPYISETITSFLTCEFSTFICSSVDAFQGDERKIIILSLTKSTPVPVQSTHTGLKQKIQDDNYSETGFYRIIDLIKGIRKYDTDEYENDEQCIKSEMQIINQKVDSDEYKTSFINSPKRVNVAITRAKNNLIIFRSYEALLSRETKKQLCNGYCVSSYGNDFNSSVNKSLSINIDYWGMALSLVNSIIKRKLPEYFTEKNTFIGLQEIIPHIIKSKNICIQNNQEDLWEICSQLPKAETKIITTNSQKEFCNSLEQVNYLKNGYNSQENIFIENNENDDDRINPYNKQKEKINNIIDNFEVLSVSENQISDHRKTFINELSFQIAESSKKSNSTEKTQSITEIHSENPNNELVALVDELNNFIAETKNKINNDTVNINENIHQHNIKTIKTKQDIPELQNKTIIDNEILNKDYKKSLIYQKHMIEYKVFGSKNKNSIEWW